VIRRATPDDAAAVAAVHEVARRAYYEAGATTSADDVAARLAFWTGVLQEPGRAAVWCAEVAGEVVGFCFLGPPLHGPPAGEPVLELHALYVRPSSWAAGLGSALHAVVVDELDTGRWVGGTLEVWSRNDRAIGFYERRGWALDGRSRPGPGGTTYERMSRLPQRRP